MQGHIEKTMDYSSPGRCLKQCKKAFQLIGSQLWNIMLFCRIPQNRPFLHEEAIGKTLRDQLGMPRRSRTR